MNKIDFLKETVIKTKENKFSKTIKNKIKDIKNKTTGNIAQVMYKACIRKHIFLIHAVDI